MLLVAAAGTQVGIAAALWGVVVPKEPPAVVLCNLILSFVLVVRDICAERAACFGGLLADGRCSI
jgi:hypothetical protein